MGIFGFRVVTSLVAAITVRSHDLPPLPTPTMSDLDPFEVRNASRVTGQLGELRESYAGYFSTDNRTKHEFWWYFPSPASKPNAPLLLWLQGGPGAASTGGLFTEMGPYEVLEEGKPSLRPVAWTDHYAMLFIDNPVGAGFSYTTGTYCEDTRDCVARNLYGVLLQLYAAFPELAETDFYITGESYAGHYVPAISAYIARMNARAEAGGGKGVIPFKGMAIGDGWTDPINMMPAYAEMMFGMGVVSFVEKKAIQDYVDRSLAALKNGDYLTSFNIWDEMMNGDVFQYKNYFHNITGSNNYYNLLSPPWTRSYHNQYIAQADVRNDIHIGTPPDSGNNCEMNLLNDFMVSFRPEIEYLLESKYKVLIYSGQLDIIIGAALTEASLYAMRWSGYDDFVASQKAVWRITPSDSEVAGFVNSGGGLIYAIVRTAGHMVPGDQPERALDMITRFVEDKEFESLPDPKDENEHVVYA